jgi:diguanylate cyclase
MLIARCQAIAAGRLDDRIQARVDSEFGQLVREFNDMSTALAASEQVRREAFDALQRSRDELEARVVQRTQDLLEANQQLSREVAERIRAERALEESAMTDPLTGLLNRRGITEFLKNEVSRFQRTATPFTLLLADLDHFKNVNDSDGHDAGDAVLVQAAARLKAAVRAQDSVSRWGGEEFLMLLPATAVEGGAVVAEKIRQQFAAQPFAIEGKQTGLTVSIGIAAFGTDDNLDECIKQADRALYRAKQAGRNRVECS